MSEREKLADEYEDHWHKQFPEGMMIADYCNRSTPGDCFVSGWDARDKLANEEVAPLIDALDTILVLSSFQGTVAKVAREALAAYREKTKC